MEVSRQLVKEAWLYPKLRLFQKKWNALESLWPQQVQLKKDKLVTRKDEYGKDVEYVRYLVIHNDELKTYDTRKLNKQTQELSYLVQRLAEFKENSYIELEGKKIGIKNYVAVTMPDDGEVLQDDYD